jgi:thiol:disulfide interchange protein DsbC
LIRFLFILYLVISSNLFADEANLKNLIEKQYPELKVKNITKTKFNGLYEVFLGGQIIYTDENFSFLIADGQLINPKTKKSITEERLMELTKVDFSKLPLDKAIKIVKGQGKHKVAVFSDLDCPFCRKLEKESLLKIDNTTIYIFPFPLAIHPDAEKKSLQIWCDADRAKSWVAFMESGKLPNNEGECDSPIKEVQKLAKSIGISSTPTIIFESGMVVPGAIPYDEFVKNL